jgi:molybdate transport system substrate-binding protein
MRRFLACVLALPMLAACGGAVASDDDATELTVFAAASLADTFGEAIGPGFEAANPGTDVTFNFAASDTLAGQIRSEGTADVFASASSSWMDEVEREPGVRRRVDFLRNRLVIVTPADDPAHISSIDDLADDGVQLVLAAEGVPAGDYAREVLANAGIADEAEANVVSNEEDSAAVVAKIVASSSESHDPRVAAPFMMSALDSRWDPTVPTATATARPAARRRWFRN